MDNTQETTEKGGKISSGIQSKIPLKLSLFIIGVMVIILSVIIIFLRTQGISKDFSSIQPILIQSNIIQSFVKKVNAQPVQSATSSRPVNDLNTSNFSAIIDSTNLGLPVRLEIPNINVDANIEYLGLTVGGAMNVPKGLNNVSWFNLGTIPGEAGSAVIAGHYGWKNDIPAVFDDLYKLQIGDKIYIKNDKGVTISFVVREIGIYDQNGDASNVFDSNDGKAHLNLITCEGVWNSIVKSYSNRLVVFTDME